LLGIELELPIAFSKTLSITNKTNKLLNVAVISLAPKYFFFYYQMAAETTQILSLMVIMSFGVLAAATHNLGHFKMKR